jgi:hypothetical protein
MTQQEIHNFLKDNSMSFSSMKLDGGVYRIVLLGGVGWADIYENETFVWDDIEVLFNESFNHSKMDESEFLKAYETALNNLYEANEKQYQEKV